MSNKKLPVVLLDMDGCLVDLFPTMLASYASETRNYVHPDNLTTYNLGVHVEKPERFWTHLGSALLKSPPRKGSSRWISLLKHMHVEIVSFAAGYAATPHEYKLRWLAAWFPEIDRENVTFTKNKWFIRADYMIDDSTENVTAWVKNNPNGIAFLVDASYNRDITNRTGIVCVESVDEAAEIISTLENIQDFRV